MSDTNIVPLHVVRRRRHPEDDLQRSVVKFLAWLLPEDATYYAVPNGGWRSKVEAARMQGLGVRAGVPDLCVLHRGRSIYIELKTPRGALTPTQRQMHRKLLLCGADVFVCRTLDDVHSVLLEAGVRLRGRY